MACEKIATIHVRAPNSDTPCIINSSAAKENSSGIRVGTLQQKSPWHLSLLKNLLKNFQYPKPQLDNSSDTL